MKKSFGISCIILSILSCFLIHSCTKDKSKPLMPPILTTTAVSALTQTSAVSGGNITSDGGATVVLSGVCWSTSANPTKELNTKTIDITGTSVFTSSLTGLTPNTKYFLRAYATNSSGTGYGETIEFTTLASDCMICKQVTYQGGIVINQSSGTEYCGAALIAIRVTPPITVGALTIKYECANK